MDYISIINKYYTPGTKLYHILLTHSRSVANKALSICKNHPELNIDVQFVEEAAMLHDIGIFRTNAPGIECYGDKPYICHGTIGAELLRNEGFPHHALVAERHTGAGISHEEIIKQNFASNKARNLYYVAQTAEEAIEYIKNYKFENLTVTKADIYKR